jgi:hypothetical protein
MKPESANLLGMARRGLRQRAAVLFGASTPFAKLLLSQGVSQWLLAGILYLGSGRANACSPRYADLFNGKEQAIDVSQVDVSMNGIELQDREFVAAIGEGREPNASVAQVLDRYRVLGELDTQLGG